MEFYLKNKKKKNFHSLVTNVQSGVQSVNQSLNDKVHSLWSSLS